MGKDILYAKLNQGEIAMTKRIRFSQLVMYDRSDEKQLKAVLKRLESRSWSYPNLLRFIALL